MNDLSFFPPLNASLNATSAVFLLIGYTLIKQRAITAHTIAMIGATCTTIIFLVCYLTYHYFHGITRFPGRGGVKVLYMTILVTHTILAALNLPLVLTTLYFAFRGKFEKHRRIARITFPIWMYVSVTGVVVYWMLYRIKY